MTHGGAGGPQAPRGVARSLVDGLLGRWVGRCHLPHTRPVGRVQPLETRTRPLPRPRVSTGPLGLAEMRHVPVLPLYHFSDRRVVPAGAVLRRHTLLVELDRDAWRPFTLPRT